MSSVAIVFPGQGSQHLNMLSQGAILDIAKSSEYSHLVELCSDLVSLDFIDLVKKHEIDYEERKHNQLFCVHSAKDIVNMLLKECEFTEVKINKNTEVKSVEHVVSSSETSGGYSIEGYIKNENKGELFIIECDSLIVATGALSVPTLGGSDFGYKLAEQYKLPLVKLRAGLVPFMFSDSLKPFCESLSGISTEAEVSCQNKSFRENILFTHRGLSGPAILQISNYWNPGQELSIDLLPGINLAEELLNEKDMNNKSLLRNYLSSFLSKSLVIELQSLLWKEVSEIPINDISN